MAIRAPLDDAIAHRYPKIIATDAFLNDDITFNTDTRFDAISALQDASDDLFAPRDEANFVIIDLGIDVAQRYVAETYTPFYSRINYQRTLK